MNNGTENAISPVKTTETSLDVEYTWYQGATEFDLIQEANNLLHVLKANSNKVCKKHKKTESGCKGCPYRILLNFGLKNGKQAKFPYCLNYIARIAQRRLNDDFFPKTGIAEDAD